MNETRIARLSKLTVTFEHLAGDVRCLQQHPHADPDHFGRSRRFKGVRSDSHIRCDTSPAGAGGGGRAHLPAPQDGLQFAGGLAANRGHLWIKLSAEFAWGLRAPR